MILHCTEDTKIVKAEHERKLSLIHWLTLHVEIFNLPQLHSNREQRLPQFGLVLMHGHNTKGHCSYLLLLECQTNAYNHSQPPPNVLGQNVEHYLGHTEITRFSLNPTIFYHIILTKHYILFSVLPTSVVLLL